MRGSIVVFSFLAALGSPAFAGDIFKCVAADGAVMYTNMACPADNQAQHIASYKPVPDSPIPAYSKPTFAPAPSAQANAAQAAYRDGYAQAQADARDETARDDSAYAAGWVPVFPVRRAPGHDHGHGHHHPPKTMAGGAPTQVRAPTIRFSR